MKSTSKSVREIVMGLRPIDDDFMRIIFKDNSLLVEYVLRIILGKDDLIVESSDTQYELGNVGLRKIYLDVYAKDSTGKLYNIEVQRADAGANPHRARYHSSALDVANLPKSKDFSELPDTYIIFITENDVLKGNLPVYNIKRSVQETGEPFEEGTHIVYVNGAYKDKETAIGKLIHDFSCNNAAEMLCEPLADITNKFKNSEEGVNHMCAEVEKLINKERLDAKKEGAIETAKNLIKDGTIPNDKIAQAVGLSLDEVNKLAAQI